MSLFTNRRALALLASVGLIVAALFATAPQAGAATIYACKKPNGTLRLVSKATRCRRGQKKLHWNAEGPAGRNGSNGANGSNGLNGARGPAGAFDFIDQQGRLIGLSAGFFGGQYPMVWNSASTIVLFDNDPSTTNAIAATTRLFYKLAGCSGPAYTDYSPSYPFQLGIILDVPAVTGAQIYAPIPGAPERFTYQSSRAAAGCTNGTGTVTNGYAVRAAGTVPQVQKPLMLQPVS